MNKLYLVLLLLTLGCTNHMHIVIENNNGYFLSKNTCDGRNEVPKIVIENIPSNTVRLNLIIHDPDAPNGDFLHYNLTIPANKSRIIIDNRFKKEGKLNDFNRIGYGGLCPPKGETHTYYIEAYAIDKQNHSRSKNHTKIQ